MVRIKSTEFKQCKLGSKPRRVAIKKMEEINDSRKDTNNKVVQYAENPSKTPMVSNASTSYVDSKGFVKVHHGKAPPKKRLEIIYRDFILTPAIPNAITK